MGDGHILGSETPGVRSWSRARLTEGVAGDEGFFALEGRVDLWNMAASSVIVSVVDYRVGGRSLHCCLGMQKLCGCHFTVSQVLLELVDGVHIL